MLPVLNELIRRLAKSPLNAQDRISAIVLAAEASEAGGYVRGPSAAILERLEGGLTGKDEAGWYFPALRSRARRLQRQARYDAKSKKRQILTPAHAGNGGEGSGEEVEGARRGDIEGVLGGDEEGNLGGGEGGAKGEGEKRQNLTEASESDGSVRTRRPSTVDAPNDHGLSVGDGYLFPMGEPDQPPAEGTFLVTCVMPDSFAIENVAKTKKPRAAKAKKPRAPRPRDPLFDRLAQLTRSDPVVSGGYIGKVADLMRQAEPPYTVEELERLPAILSKTKWWDGKLSLYQVERNIGLVRAEAPAAEPTRSEEVTVFDLNPQELRLYVKGERCPTLAHYCQKALAMAAKRLGRGEGS